MLNSPTSKDKISSQTQRRYEKKQKIRVDIVRIHFRYFARARTHTHIVRYGEPWRDGLTFYFDEKEKQSFV